MCASKHSTLFSCCFRKQAATETEEDFSSFEIGITGRRLISFIWAELTFPTRKHHDDDFIDEAYRVESADDTVSVRTDVAEKYIPSAPKRA